MRNPFANNVYVYRKNGSYRGLNINDISSSSHQHYAERHNGAHKWSGIYSILRTSFGTILHMLHAKSQSIKVLLMLHSFISRKKNPTSWWWPFPSLVLSIISWMFVHIKCTCQKHAKTVSIIFGVTKWVTAVPEHRACVCARNFYHYSMRSDKTILLFFRQPSAFRYDERASSERPNQNEYNIVGAKISGTLCEQYATMSLTRIIK